MNDVHKCRILIRRLPLSKGQNFNKTTLVITVLVIDLQLHCLGLLILCHFKSKVLVIMDRKWVQLLFVISMHCLPSCLPSCVVVDCFLLTEVKLKLMW